MKGLKKTDIHCHILPGLDDGSSSIQETMKMIQMASEQGISQLIATPHYSFHFQDARPETVRSLCKKTEREIAEATGSEFHIYPGQEIMYQEEVPQMLKNGELLTMAGSHYVLVEFMINTGYSDIFRAVRNLLTRNYWPIVAHVERYPAVRESGCLEELMDIGAYIQINYRSIGGSWFNDTTRWCRRQLQRGNVHFLGTDMHNTGSRAPETLPAEKWMKSHLDTEYIRELYWENPLRILEDARI